MEQARDLQFKALTHVGRDNISRMTDNITPRGKMIEVGISNGGCVGLYDLYFDRKYSVATTAAPMLQVSIMLEGNGASWLSGFPKPIPFRPGCFFLFYANKPISVEHVIPVDSRIRLVKLRFATDYGNNFSPISCVFLSNILRLFRKDVFLFSDDEDGNVRLARFPTPIAIRRIAFDMLDKKPEAWSDKLWLEAKSLEILAFIIEFLESNVGPHGGDCIELSRRDQKAIHDAYDMLVAKPDHDWTIKKIARSVGVNENKLKRGFGSIFGTSVYACLQRHRITVAAEKIRNDDDSITRIALSVGYSNPAHFAKLFRRYYQMSPRDYRRKNWKLHN